MNRLHDWTTDLSLVRDKIAKLRVSKERKNNLLQRIWAVTDSRNRIQEFVDNLESSTFQGGKQRTNRGEKDLPDYRNRVIYDLYRREIDLESSTDSEEDLSRFSIQFPENETLSLLNRRECIAKAAVALYPFAISKDVVPEEPTSSFLLPLSLNYMPKQVRKTFYSDGASFSLVYKKAKKSHDKYFVLKHDFLFEFNTKIEADRGDLPSGVLSLFTLDSFVAHKDLFIELEFSPSYIDYSDDSSMSGTDDISMTSGKEVFVSKSQKPLLPHMARSCGTEFLALSKREYGPRRVTLSTGSSDPGAVKRLTSLINIFTEYDKSYLRNIYDFEKVPIGRGKFSVVFKANPFDKSKGLCAIKVMKKEEFWQFVEQKSEKPDTLSREVGINLYLRKKNGSQNFFVLLQDIIESERFLVFEMELMHSMDLFQYLSNNSDLSRTYIKKLIRHLLGALEFLQNEKIAHRDVKLSNVVLKGPDLEPRLIDFGLAMFEDSSGKLFGRCGTPGFIAPEILSKEAKAGYGNNVDVFSLGIVLFILLVGYEPFVGSTDKELILANRRCEIVYNPRLWSSQRVSEDARNLVELMLQPSQHTRPSPKDLMQHCWLQKPEISNLGSELQLDRNKSYSFCTLS